MNKWTSLGMLAWLILVVGGGVTAWAASRELAPAPPASPSAAEARSADIMPSPYPVDSLAAVIVGRNVFRMSRDPAATPYDPLATSNPATRVEVYDRPFLTLVGIVQGPEVTAVIHGIPSMEETAVVREGERIAGLLIKSISDGTVEVVGLDTVWVLTVDERWRGER